MEQSNKTVHYRNFTSLLSLNYLRIYNFILMLVANHNDADDIMQESSIVMYEKFSSFDYGTDFLAWARTIAKYQTLAFLKKQKGKRVSFDWEIIDRIEQESQGHLRKQEEWLRALQKCVSLLPQPDRQLLDIRYREDVSIKEIANRLGCSFQRIYRSLSHINGLLVHCIRSKVVAGEF